MDPHRLYKLQANTFKFKQIHTVNEKYGSMFCDQPSWLTFRFYLCMHVFSFMCMQMLGSCAYPPAGGWGPDCQGYSHQGLNRWEVGSVCHSACRNPDLHLSSRGQQPEPTVEGDVWGEMGLGGKKIYSKLSWRKQWDKWLDIQALHFPPVVC